ncbi:MAG TPA: efflux transporter periplasmic adaptor subunit [Oxalobacteraceae bacterium]|nr:efflux transporter periplasmic adaptor subunit [Oxalobacteraceae bacterium]
MKKPSLPLTALAFAMLYYVFTPAALAAPPSAPVKVAVADSQIRALGIQTMPLQAQGESVKASYPAQAVVPSGAEQVVSSPVAGMVSQLLAQPNQAVRAGTPLVRIASPELGQLQLQLLQASARATLARQAVQREKSLFDEGIIPQRRLQEAQAALAEHQAALNQAKAALRLAGMPNAEIDRIASTGKPQDSITLSAPRAGIVTKISVKPGQRVDAATALLHVAQTDTLALEIQLPATSSSRWPAGTRVTVPGRGISARILSTGVTVSPNSQTLVLRAAIEGKADQLHPGEFVTVELPGAAAQDGWDVPLSALVYDGKQAYLFVRSVGGFEARAVQTLASAGQHVRVQGPLKAGEQIAVSGVVALKGAWLDARETK